MSLTLLPVLALSLALAVPAGASRAKAPVNRKPHVIPTLREWEGGDGYLALAAGSRICVPGAQLKDLRRAGGPFQ